MSDDTTRTTPKSPPLDRMSLLWQRVSEHKIAQWSVAYVALSYAIQHAVILTSEFLEWPAAIARVTMLVLIFGLPLVMLLAWYHGHHASRHVSKVEFSIIALLLAVGSLWFYVFINPREQSAASPAAVREAGVTAVHNAASGVSIAVLPFVNLSSDKEQEFFSDGMTEEITSALAKVSGLNVVGRTSAFQFKGENKDLTAIGLALHATHLIEGSVRRDGNEVRITAQLIRADNGTHLWTESYNRELKGVFALQEEIATAIAASLRVPLGLKEGQNLVANRTSDTDSYQDYLRAKALVRSRGALEPGGPLTQAVKLLEPVVARDPKYAPAWALLGYAYDLTAIYSAASFNGLTDELRRIAADALQKGEMAGQLATRLDANNTDAYIALGAIDEDRGRFAQAEDYYKKALALDPGNPDAAHRYGHLLSAVGRLKEAVFVRERLQAQEPFVPIFNTANAMIFWEGGRNEQAAAILKSQPPTVFSRVILAEVYASMGRYTEAADAFGEVPSGVFPAEALKEAQRLLRIAPTKSASPQTAVSSGLLGFVYLHTGVPDRALDFYEHLAEAGTPALGGLSGLAWAPTYGPVHKTDRFKAYVRNIGLVDYWKARGWPDLCHPTTGDDFACE